MTASSRRSSRRRSTDAIRLLAIVGCGLLALTGPLPAALAQTETQPQVGKPIQLLPQTTPENDLPSVPAPPQGGGTTGQPNAPQGFEVTPLEAVGTDYAGTLEP